MLRVIPCLVALGLVAGCGGPSPTTLKLMVAASAQLNPNSENQPSPTVIRIYDLKASDKFNTASFFQIYDSDTTTLGGDMLNRQEIVVEPGQTTTINANADPATRFIGVVAAFRDLTGSNWRAFMKVEPQDDNPVMLTLQTTAVTLNKPKPSHFLGIF